MGADGVVEVLKAWKENAVLCKTATTGVMASVGKTAEIGRKEVAVNSDLLAPVVLHLGVLATMDKSCSLPLVLRFEADLAGHHGSRGAVPYSLPSTGQGFAVACLDLHR